MLISQLGSLQFKHRMFTKIRDSLATGCKKNIKPNNGYQDIGNKIQIKLFTYFYVMKSNWRRINWMRYVVS